MEKIQFKTTHFLRKYTLSTLALALTAGLISGCQSESKNESGAGPRPIISEQEKVSKAPGEVSIMAMNVENLFDTIHDENREDYTYLPLADKKNEEVQKFCDSISNNFYKQECKDLDWNEEVLKVKMKNIGQVIRFVDQGQGPDNLGLVEVENERILKRLVETELKDLGYQTVILLEGPDTRGIDPGFISKFPMVGKPRMNIIPFTDLTEEESKIAKRTRGILEVTVKPPQGPEMTFFVGHFPSQSNPTKLRKQALQFAQNLLTKTMDSGKIGIVLGDLNVSADEDKEEKLFENTLVPVSHVSHLVGCSDCLGSHFYRGEWSFLDVIAVSKNIEKLNWEITPNSIQVVRVPVHMKKNGTPLRFDPDNREGVSDHFPLYKRLKNKTASSQ
jgi:hypothetical protein